MKLLFSIFLLVTSLSAAEEWDVTSGIVRRNWRLVVGGTPLAWFSTKENCEVWGRLFYKEKETTCVLK